MQLVEALRYETEGHSFDFRWGHWLNPSGCAMVLASTEMSTSDFLWGVKAAGVQG